MFAKYVAAGLAGSALFATVAFAQTPTTTSDSAKMAPAASSSASTSSFQGDWRTSKVVGLNVYNDSNESVGSINDLLTDKSGNIKAAVISVGGVLGVGAHLVAIPFDKIKFVNEPVAYTGTRWGRRRQAGIVDDDDGRCDHVGSGHDLEAQSLVSGSCRVQRDQG